MYDLVHTITSIPFQRLLCPFPPAEIPSQPSLLQGKVINRLTGQNTLEKRQVKKPPVARSLQVKWVHLQLRGQLLIRPGLTVRLRQDADRLVEFSVDDTLFATTGSPDLIIAPFLLLDHLGTVQQSAHHLDDQFRTPGRIRVQARAHEPRMNGQGLNLRVSVREFSRQQRVGEFALSVPCPFGHGPSIHGRLELLELDSLRGSALIRNRREHDDTDIGTGNFGGLEQEGEEELDEESVGEVVDPELQFVSIFGQSRGFGHDAGVAHQDVQTIRGELVKGGLDRVKGGEIGFEERDVHIWGGGLDVGCNTFAAGFVAGGEIDLGMVILGMLGARRWTNSCGPWETDE